MKQKNIIIGKGAKIDGTVVLGYIPERRTRLSKKVTIGKKAYIRSNTVIYLGVKIGDDLNVGHNVVIREENSIGNSFNIWSNSIVDYGCKIGNRVKLHSNVYVAQFTVLEDDVFLAPGVIIGNDMHPGCKFSKKCLKGPVVKKGAQVGINATILPRVIIGKHVLIGAASVVTQDIPDYSMAFGNPARVHGDVREIRCKTDLTDYPYKF